MKKLLSGNEAIAQGAWEAGCEVATAYPGTPSTEILESMARYPEIKSEWSVNEKVALEVASGASYAGARSLAAMKHVGLNVAADPLFTLSYTGIEGGLVVVTADDPNLYSSQNEQDNRHFARAAKIPMLEPSDSEEARRFAKIAFELSEKFDCPVLLRCTTRISHGESLVETAKGATSAQIASAISLEDQHTAEEVPVLAVGPGSNRARGFISNTDIFHIMMGALGWETYRTQARYPVSGDGGWDYITMDSEARRLYVSHDTQVNVLDADTGKPIGVIADTPGVHGTAIASAQRHGFTSNGKEDKVSIFDLADLRLIRKVDVGKGPDGIYFDTASNRVFTNNHGSHDVSAIDAATGEVVGTVQLDGDGEQAIAAANGLIYVNSENTSEVVAFDPKTLQVKSRYALDL